MLCLCIVASLLIKENLKRDKVEAELRLSKRNSKLEALLIESSEEKDRLREDIIELTSEVATLKQKSKYLDKENTYLKGQRKARKK